MSKLPKKTLIDKMKESASAAKKTKEQHFGDGVDSRIGKKRIDCFVTEEEYRQLTIRGANLSPVLRPNRYAETIIRNSLK
jgi:hypothetical protein